MDIYQKDIIEKLFHLNAWGAIHKTEETILKGKDKKDYGELKKALKKLVTQNLVVKKSHRPDYAYHLNRERKREIYEILGLL